MSSKPTKEAIAFAFVAKSFEEHGDALRGLVPLFAAAIGARAGAIFEARAIADEVNRTFDFDISPLVVESMVPAFVNEGLLQRLAEHGVNSELYRCLALKETSNATEDGVVNLFHSFRGYATEALSVHKIEASAEEIDDCLLDALTEADMLGLSLKGDVDKFRGRTLTLKKDEVDLPERTKVQALTYLAARFIQVQVENGGVHLNSLVQAAWGAIISEVVAALQRPGDEARLSDLKVYLDSPILLDALGVGEKNNEEYALDLIDLANKSGATLCAFPHVAEEMEEILRVLLGRLDTGHTITGPLAQRLRKEPSLLLKVRAISKSIDASVRGLGVDIPDVGLIEGDLRAYFSDESIVGLRAQISQNSFHEAVARDMRDARSIGYVIRLRKATFPSSIGASEAVFVTRNAGLVQAGEAYLHRVNLLPKYAPSPCVTDRQLAGILWFCTGGGGQSMTRSKLVANCAIAVAPKKELVTTMAQMLFDRNPEDAKKFEALIRDDRAAMCLVNETLGVASLVDADSVDSLFERMHSEFKQSAGEEYERKMGDALAEIRSDHLRKVGDFERQLDQAGIEVRDLRERSAMTEHQASDAERRADALKTRNHAALALVRDKHEKLESRTRKRVVLEIHLLVALLSIFLSGLAFEGISALFIGLVVFLIGFWRAPDLIFGAVPNYVAKKARKAAELDDEEFVRTLEQPQD